MKNTFNSSKDAYDAITTKINSTTVNTDKKIKFLNDAYFAYVYLLRCFNSIIENFNIILFQLAKAQSPFRRREN